ncbi:MAG TPA: VCBS repeat-containing protein [Myxococcaceae bacterium]|nr:VCBS repeat-containing protein [Myxococcaceae bacterium]
MQSATSRGSFAPGRVHDGLFGASFIAAADLNGDGRIDLVVNEGPSVLSQSATTPGTFSPVRKLR